jgi:HTH-type transcriptional regulator / antitoxin HigA
MAIKNQYIPQSIPHPGETLAEKLQEIGMGPKEFAIRTGKPEKTITAVINGTSSVTPEMALLFENVLKIPARFWLQNQGDYDEYVEREKRLSVFADAKEWAKSFPYAYMANLGWVQQARNTDEKAQALLNFFSMASIASWENYYLGQKLLLNFRISLKHTREPYAVSAWLRQGEISASKFAVPEYSAYKFKKNLGFIKEIMATQPPDFFIRLRNICSEAGVKVVYTPCLPKAPINGSSRWIGNTPLIQLSARYKQNDILWFTFFHEAGHILLHGKKYISLEGIDSSQMEKEKENEADNFAVNWTFSKEQEAEILASIPIQESEIIEFAKKFNTHPALIIGRFHHNGFLQHNYGRQFIVPIDLSSTNF